VVVETHVLVMPFGAIWASIIVPNSPLPTKWSNKKTMVVMLELNAKFEWTIITIIMAPTRHVLKHELFCAFNFILF
jgi:hypothetical protein